MRDEDRSVRNGESRCLRAYALGIVEFHLPPWQGRTERVGLHIGVSDPSWGFASHRDQQEP